MLDTPYIHKIVNPQRKKSRRCIILSTYLSFSLFHELMRFYSYINKDKFFGIFCTRLENDGSARKIGSFLHAILDIEKDKAAMMELRIIKLSVDSDFRFYWKLIWPYNVRICRTFFLNGRCICYEYKQFV